MMTHMHCTNCGHKLKQAIGADEVKIKCPNCQILLTINNIDGELRIKYVINGTSVCLQTVKETADT